MLRGEAAIMLGKAMAKVSQAQEPSMEEILSSIRRIIADEEDTMATTKPAPASAGKPAPAAVEEEMSVDDIDKLFGEGAEVLELSEEQAVVAAAEEAPANDSSVIFVDPRAKASEAPAVSAAPQSPSAVAAAQGMPDELPAGRLLSSTADAAVTNAFNSLANTILSSHARTLEDLVKDMLRPIIKAWLDTNLPPLVERLVREEIERVSRGR